MMRRQKVVRFVQIIVARFMGSLVRNTREIFLAENTGCCWSTQSSSVDLRLHLEVLKYADIKIPPLPNHCICFGQLG